MPCSRPSSALLDPAGVLLDSLKGRGVWCFRGAASAHTCFLHRTRAWHTAERSEVATTLLDDYTGTQVIFPRAVHIQLKQNT